LAIQLLHDQGEHPTKLDQLLDDPDPAVQLEAAICLTTKTDRLRAVAHALRAGAAASPRLRYRAALEVARLGNSTDFEKLLTDRDDDVRLAGLIALDEAFHEGVRAEAARKALVGLISEPRGAPLAELLAVAERWPHASLKQPIILALQRDLSAEATIGGVAVLRHLMLPPTRDTLDRFWSRMAAGDVPLVTLDEKLGTLDLLAMARPGPDTVVVLGRLVRDEHDEVRAEAHHVLTTIAAGNQACIELCWKLLGDGNALLEHRLETIVSLSQIETELSRQAWLKLLSSPSRKLALVALRCLRNHTDRTAVAELFETTESRLTARGTDFAAALRLREQSVAVSPGSGQNLAQLYAAEKDPAAARRKDGLRARMLQLQEQGDPLLGRLVFRSQVCHRCHRFGGQAKFAGPPLDGVAATNSVEYLIDSILYPSKAIKTGFMLELIVTQQGRVLVGGVARQGDELIVTSPFATTDRVQLKDVEERRRLNRSLMPESLEITMSEPELFDLIAYLATLREGPGS
jgi:putative heme-binding domain-containing protein